MIDPKIVKIIKYLKEDEEIGQSILNPQTGVRTTLTNIDPETGRREWNVQYEIDPKVVYTKLEELVKYLDKAKRGSDLAQFRDILKNLKNKTARLINKSK